MDGGAAARGDYDGMRALRESVDVQIAGEMTRQAHDFRELISGFLDVLQPDAALVGGITGLRRTAIMAQERNIVFSLLIPGPTAWDSWPTRTWSPDSGTHPSSNSPTIRRNGISGAATTSWPNRSWPTARLVEY